MAITALAAASTTTPASGGTNTGSSATSAFGLGFDSLLKIILTQLTYQDPLKPMDNFQFVSQLAQFSQIQIGQSTNEKLDTLVAAQGNLQATNLLGRQVDIGTGTSLVTGTVTAIAFESGAPRLTVETSTGQTISSVSLASISQIREGD